MRLMVVEFDHPHDEYVVPEIREGITTGLTTEILPRNMWPEGKHEPIGLAFRIESAWQLPDGSRVFDEVLAEACGNYVHTQHLATNVDLYWKAQTTDLHGSVWLKTMSEVVQYYLLQDDVVNVILDLLSSWEDCAGGT